MKGKSDHRSKFSNLSNWKKEALKKSGLQRDSNLWPLWYQCDALPIKTVSKLKDGENCYIEDQFQVLEEEKKVLGVVVLLH